MALIPTLSLWRFELERAGAGQEAALAFQNVGVQQLADYFSAGGEVLFGTDVGYTNEYDTEEEFQLMAAAGMKFDDVLASLTTNPATRFRKQDARLAEGEAADIVVYQNDPASDVANFSRIAYTIKDGRVVYQASARAH